MKILAQITDGFVSNAIVVPEDATPAFAADVLGLPGAWVLADEGTVGVGFLYDDVSGEFLPPPPPPYDEDEPPTEEPPVEA